MGGECNEEYGFPTPSRQHPTAQDVMNHVTGIDFQKFSVPGELLDLWSGRPNGILKGLAPA